MENIEANIDLLDIVSTKFCSRLLVARVQGISITKGHISVSRNFNDYCFRSMTNLSLILFN